MNGLANLSRMLTQAQMALSALDGTLGQLSFAPDDPASIEAAIMEMEHLIDERVKGFESNSIIAGLVAEMKDKYREAIVQKAAQTRAGEKPT
jgi:hypothetical protein